MSLGLVPGERDGHVGLVRIVIPDGADHLRPKPAGNLMTSRELVSNLIIYGLPLKLKTFNESFNLDSSH